MKSNNVSVEYMKSIYHFQEKLGDQNIILTYQGQITQDIIRSLSLLTENNLEKVKEDETVVARVYHVMIECLQNILKHAGETIETDKVRQKSGIFLGEYQGKYIITTGNIIANSNIEELTALLDKLNNMDKQELKALYREQIFGGKVSEKGGAGLGFIEMARKSQEPLECHFEPVDDDTSYMLLCVRISKRERA